MKVTIGILSYNMPHLTDALYQQLRSMVKIMNVNYVVVDNGSDPDKVAKSTTHWMGVNERLTGGMNRILKEAQGSDYVWLCTNDIKLKSDYDPLGSLIGNCFADPSIGCIHPSLMEPVRGYAYPWMIHTPWGEPAPEKPRGGVAAGAPMVDIICPLYTKAALDSFGWQFDSRFTYGWGIDYDSCYHLRQAGLKVAVDFGVVVDHQTSVTYDSGRDREFKKRNEYYQKAFENMNTVMESKYGTNWRSFFF